MSNLYASLVTRHATEGRGINAITPPNPNLPAYGNLPSEGIHELICGPLTFAGGQVLLTPTAPTTVKASHRYHVEWAPSMSPKADGRSFHPF